MPSSQGVFLPGLLVKSAMTSKCQRHRAQYDAEIYFEVVDGLLSTAGITL